MNFFDYIFRRKAAHKENPKKLSSYEEEQQSLICKNWKRLDMSLLETYLDHDMKWKSSAMRENKHGKMSYLNQMNQVFASLEYSKKSYRADVDGSEDRAVAIVTIDGEGEDMMHRVKIEDGIIKEIEITPSPYWWNRQLGGHSPFGVIHQTSLHEQAAAVAAIENYVKTELGNKPIKWATQYELRNSCCQLTFTCDGLDL